MTKLQVETYGGVLLRKRSLLRGGIGTNRAGELCRQIFSAGGIDLSGHGDSGSGGDGKAVWDTQMLARNMTAQAAEIGFDLRIAMAANPDTAFLAARGFSLRRSPSFLPEKKAEQLAPLPVNVLPISPEMLEILKGWGIRTLSIAGGVTCGGSGRTLRPGRFVPAKAGARRDQPSAVDG